MPVLGYGTYKLSKDRTAECVSAAIMQGYRLIDTGAFYGNETEVGAGIRGSGVERGKIFLTTKLWLTDYGYSPALRAFDESLRRLDTDYVDLYLLHYPTPSNFPETLEAYRALERLVADRRVRAIGVSNFGPTHLSNLIGRTRVWPAVNQVEYHPYFQPADVRSTNERYAVWTQAWSPLGGIYINHPRDPKNVIRLLDNPRLVTLAQQYRRDPAQIVLRWHLQSGRSVIPKAENVDHMMRNLEVFDFELSPSEMVALNAIDMQVRGGIDPEIFDKAFLARRAAQRKA